MISHIAPTDLLVGRYNNSNSFSCFRGAMRLLLIALYKYPYLLTYLLTYLFGFLYSSTVLIHSECKFSRRLCKHFECA